MSLPYLEWDDEAGWAAVGCAMPTDADLEGLSLDECELREGVAACGRRHTPESPCLANGDGVLFWVSLVDDPLGHVLVPDKGAFRSKTLAGLGAEAPTPYKASIDATRRKVVAAIAVSDVVLIDKPTFRALHTRTPTSSAFI